eukprot:98161_1
MSDEFDVTADTFIALSSSDEDNELLFENDDAADADRDSESDAEKSEMAPMLELDQKQAVTIQMIRDGRTPVRKFFMAGTILLSMIFVALLRGGSHGAPSLVGIDCGTRTYWVVTLVAVAFFVTCTAVVARRLLKEARYRDSINYPYVEGDVRWTLFSVV